MALRQRAIQAEDKEERRTAILNAAERLLGNRADRMPSVAEVAEAAGLAKGTVYLYFPGREELFLALHERNVEGFFAELIALLDTASTLGFDEIFGVTRRQMIEAPLFLPLASRCLGIMHNEIPPAAAAEFHGRMSGRLVGAGAAIERHFSLTAGAGVHLLQHSYALVIGLWQLASAHEDAGGRPGYAAGVFAWDYPTELQRALTALWEGTIMLARRDAAGGPK